MQNPDDDHNKDPNDQSLYTAPPGYVSAEFCPHGLVVVSMWTPLGEMRPHVALNDAKRLLRELAGAIAQAEAAGVSATQVTPEMIWDERGKVTGEKKEAYKKDIGDFLTEEAVRQKTVPPWAN